MARGGGAYRCFVLRLGRRGMGHDEWPKWRLCGFYIVHPAPSLPAPSGAAPSGSLWLPPAPSGSLRLPSLPFAPAPSRHRPAPTWLLRPPLAPIRLLPARSGLLGPGSLRLRPAPPTRCGSGQGPARGARSRVEALAPGSCRRRGGSGPACPVGVAEGAAAAAGARMHSGRACCRTFCYRASPCRSEKIFLPLGGLQLSRTKSCPLRGSPPLQPPCWTISVTSAENISPLRSKAGRCVYALPLFLLCLPFPLVLRCSPFAPSSFFSLGCSCFAFPLFLPVPPFSLCSPCCPFSAFLPLYLSPSGPTIACAMMSGGQTTRVSGREGSLHAI